MFSQGFVVLGMRTLYLLAPFLFAVPFVHDAGEAQNVAPPGLSAGDRAEGARADPQLQAQFGGAYEGRQAAYVESVGQRIAVQSGLASGRGDYHVTLLNSNVNNAFAIPGGYVYVTRQLVALMNDEAELAFVMGHEIGHVAAQHAKKREQRSALSGIGAALLGAITGSNVIGNLAGTGAQLYTLGYSRDQEREADSLGVRYLARAGYDTQASGDILQSLGAQTSLEARLAGQDGREPAGWLSTHPATADRVARIRREAAAAAARAGANATNRDAFLNAIDGMAYDEDPSQGVVQGRSFRHPGIRIAFTAPPGFALQNTATAVTGTGQGGSRFTFGGGAANGVDIAGYSARVWQAAGAQAPGVSRTTINGVEAGVSQMRVDTKSGPVDATLAVYRWGPDSYYHLLALEPAGQGGRFDTMIDSVRRLSPAEAAGIKGRRVSVVSVRAGDTVASLAARMAYADDRVARFTTLNGIAADARLVPGSRVKLIVAG